MSELRCINCDNDINDDDDEEHFVEATIDSASKFCHLKCFRCNICNELLTGWYFEKGGLVYCRKDYYHKYGERCRHCCNVMSGPVMVVGGGSEIKFHPECFKCSNCAAIIGDDESYACLQECQLFCKLCFTNNCDHSDILMLRSCLNFHEVEDDNNGKVRVLPQQQYQKDDEEEENEARRHKLYASNEQTLQNGVVNTNNIVNNHNNNSHHPQNYQNEHKQHQHRDAETKKESKFVGNGRQYSVRILPSLLVNDVSEKRLAKRMIKLIVRECQVNNRNSQLLQHHDSCDVTKHFNGSPIVSLNNHSLETSKDLNADLHYDPIKAAKTTTTSSGMLQISDIDVKYDLDHFHIGGDRLITLNSIPIDDKTLHELECLLDSSKDDIVELTLEHRSQPLKATAAAGANPTAATEGDDQNCVSQANFDVGSSFSSESQSDLSRSESEERPQEIRVLGKPPIRPNSVLSTTNLNCLKKNINSLNSGSTDSNNVPESVLRKSRANDKRNRNRERSSSLSRLLETIRLSSESNSPSKDHRECSTTPTSTTNTNSTATATNEYCDYYPTEEENGQDSESVRPIPKLLSSLSHTTRLGRFSNSLSRTKSFRVEPKSYRIFRAADLVKGDLLGKGSFGEVYEVTDKVTKEKMVLKELYHNDREAEANFVREVQILKSLNHKNVLHFIGILYRGRKLNLITEYITGGTLKELIQQRQTLRSIFWPERIGWARDIASGMNYLHSMSLIHRDLNSQNCLVREDGTVVVADFGLSKIICTDDNDENMNVDLNPQMQKLIRRRDRRKRYTIVGNPFWMAPEMMHRNKYDERVDIYSFGIILLEIIGSMDADPDDLRRNGDFSVDKKYFLENFVQKSCPNIFWQIAFLCTEMNPDHRPPFHVQERWFQVIYNSMAYSHQKLSFRNLADSGTLFQHDSALIRDVSVHDPVTNYDHLVPNEIQHEVSTFNIPRSPSP